MMIAAISILCNSFFEINEQQQAKVVLYWERDTDGLMWSRKRQVQHCIGAIGALVKLVSFVVWEAWMRTVILSYLVMCSPAKDYAGLVAIASLSLFIIKLILVLAKFCLPCLFPTNLVVAYDQTVRFFYKAVILVSVTLIISNVLNYCWVWVQEVGQSAVARIEQNLIHYLVEYLLAVASHCRPEGLSGYGGYEILFSLGLVSSNLTTPDTPESDWREKLRSGDGMLVVEENEDYYRVRIAIFHWEFSKEDEASRKIFAVLLATARDEQDKPVVNSRTLAQALGWSHHDLLNRLVRAWENAGNSFRGVIERHSKAGHSKLFRAVLAILRQDFSLSLLEIHSRISECQERWARQTTIGQINEVLKQISFGEIHEDLREYCAAQKQRQLAMKFSEDQVKIERSATGYRVILGNLFWEIEHAKIFTWIAIIHTLLTARTDKNKRITGVVLLADMLGLEYYQKLQTLLERYRYIADRFHDLSSVLAWHSSCRVLAAPAE